MHVAGLLRYSLDTGFARVDILHGYSSYGPRGLVLPDTFGMDRDTSLWRLGRSTGLTHGITNDDKKVTLNVPVPRQDGYTPAVRDGETLSSSRMSYKSEYDAVYRPGSEFYRDARRDTLV